MSKAKKAALIIVGVLSAAAAVFIIRGAFYINRIHFDNYQNRSHGVVIDGQDLDRMRADGYSINFPWFENVTSWTLEKDLPIYSAIIDPLQCYAIDIADTYDNWARLDYTVTESKEDKTLTIAFTGLGYPDEGNGEPRCLDRTFVFDVSEVNNGVLPVLISDEAADPDAVEELAQRIMRGEPLNVKGDSAKVQTEER